MEVTVPWIFTLNFPSLPKPVNNQKVLVTNDDERCLYNEFFPTFSFLDPTISLTTASVDFPGQRLFIAVFRYSTTCMATLAERINTQIYKSSLIWYIIIILKNNSKSIFLNLMLYIFDLTYSNGKPAAAISKVHYVSNMSLKSPESNEKTLTKIKCKIVNIQ